MPVQQCTVDGKPCYRWGDSGHAYPYTAGDNASQGKAYQEAVRQGSAVHASQAIAKGISGSGVMVALQIPQDIASKLGSRAVPAGEMHCTLAYLGKMDEVHPDTVKRALAVVKDVALGFRPLKARLGGYGLFKASKSSDGRDVMYASYDAPILPELRQQIFNGLRDAGVPLKGLSHGFTPHVTTDYIEPGKVIDPPSIPEDEFEAAHVSLYIGDARIDIPLGGDNEFREDESAEFELSPADVVALKMLGLHVVQKDYTPPPGNQIKRDVQLIGKSDATTMEQLAYGVVLEPETVDGQDHAMTDDDVKFTAHHFLAVQGIAGYRHYKQADATVVESYIAPCDFQLGGQLVKKGSWVVVMRVNDSDLWQQILRGEITGYSVGGFGKLQPLAKLNATA